MHKSPRVSIVCAYCKKSFETLPKWRNKMYCDMKCYSADRRQRSTHICKQCGKEFHRKKHGAQIATYCSNACQSASKRTAPDVTCKVCGTIFKSRKLQGRRKLHCSKECADKSARTQVTLKCQTCKKQFNVIIGRKDTAKFCSRRCKSHFRGETIPEKKIRQTLTRLKIPFEQEKSCGNGKSNYSIDFFLPASNIALEVDGVYWHTGREAHDARRTKFLLSKGIRTIRITDAEINSASNLSRLIRERIQGIHTLGL